MSANCATCWSARSSLHEAQCWASNDFPDRPAIDAAHDGPLPFPATLGEIARAAAAAMLAQCAGNKSETARRLGISRARLMRLLNVNPDSDP